MENKFSIQYNILCKIIFSRSFSLLKANPVLSDDQITLVNNTEWYSWPNKFKTVYQNRQKFLSKFQLWLQGFFDVPFFHLPGTSDKSTSVPLSIKQGRRLNNSSEKCSIRATKYKVQFARVIVLLSLIDAILHMKSKDKW